MDQTIILVHDGVLGYNTMWACRWIPVFWGNILKIFRAEDGGSMFL
jgi:hypothetical protein